MKAATLGGIGAKIGGGKFADGAVTGAFGYLFNECQHTRACGSDSTKVEVTGNQVLGGTAHTEIQITGGYDYTILEAGPNTSLKLEGRHNNDANSGDSSNGFRTTLSPPGGMTTGSYATALKGAAGSYMDTLDYSFPSGFNSNSLGLSGKGYNSNSYVSGIINKVNGSVNQSVPIAAGQAGFRLPGWNNPIPLK